MHYSKNFTINHCLCGATFYFLFKLVLKKGEGKWNIAKGHFKPDGIRGTNLGLSVWLSS